MRPRPDSQRVVVSGIGVVCSIGLDLAAFRRGLRSGSNGISRVEAFDTSGYRSQHAGEIKDLGALAQGWDERPDRLDRASILALAATRQAFADSGLAPDPGLAAACGVSVGSCAGGYLKGYEYFARRVRTGRPLPSRLLDLPLHAPASRICRSFRLRGPVHLVSNACASSAIAVGWGADLVRSGEARAMVAGGYDALTPLNCAGFGAMRNSSPTNTLRPFDRRRDGVLMGEAAAILILESREGCLARGGRARAEILGYGVSSDAYHITAPDPSGAGAAAVMELALRDAGLATDEVDYINAHGTGTIHNDRMEALAIQRLFGERSRRIPVSATKSMVGHCLGAAGAVELAASIVAMNAGFVPPTLNYETPDPQCDLDCVPRVARPACIENLLCNSFGFGGTNCCVAVGAPRP